MPEDDTPTTPNDTPAPVTPPQAPAPAKAELEALKAQLADTATQMLAGVPENLRGIIPANLEPTDLIAWFQKAIRHPQYTGFQRRAARYS